MQQEWRDEDWIGRGLQYTPNETHPVVAKQRKTLLQIPAEFDEGRPHPHLSVKALEARLVNVTQGAAIPGREIQLFSPEQANVGLAALFRACILPPKAVLNHSQNDFGQLWFDGQANSVIDWTQHNVRYPLPALTIYLEFERAFVAQSEWMRASHWMDRAKSSLDVEAAKTLAHSLMHTYEWDVDLRVIETCIRTKDVFELLGDRWLNDNHIDMLIQTLTDRIRRENVHSNVIVAPCAFQQYLQAYYGSPDEKKQRAGGLLNKYMEDFISGRKAKLYFVGHIQDHWVAWRVDYAAGTIAHGESLGWTERRLEPLKKCLLRWLGPKGGNGKEFIYLGNHLVHGDQTGDSDSCGIIACNVIGHELFMDNIWTLGKRKCHRIDAFNEVVKRHNRSNIRIHSTLSSANYSQQSPGTSAGISPDVLVYDALAKVTHDGPMAVNEVDVPDTVKSHTLKSPVQIPSPTRMSEPSSCFMPEEEPQHTKTTKNMNATPVVLCSKRGRESDGQRGEKSKKAKTGPLDAFFKPKTAVYSQQREASEPFDEEGGKEGGREIKRPQSNMDDTHALIVGVSRSVRASQRQREALRSGTFILNESYFNTFKAQICEIDQNAAFKPLEWKVRHSKCQEWLTMRAPYSSRYFSDHVHRCKAGSTLHDFVHPGVQSVKKTFVSHTCCGLTPSHDLRIQTYLCRPSALGGGGIHRHRIALKRYGKAFSKLNKRQKKEVDKLNELGWLWVIKHQYNAVFSTKCRGTIKTLANGPFQDTLDRTCDACRALLNSKQFRNAISHPVPRTSNMKYSNKSYCHEELGVKFAKVKGVDRLLNPKDEDSRTAVSYAIGVVNGEFKEDIVLAGLVNAVLKRKERESRGKKLTNFRYNAAFDEFITTVSLVSPRAHRLLAEHFQVRSCRSIGKILAKERQFTGGITSRSFELADEFITALAVPNRHVALSADDTTLLPTLRPFLDHEAGQWFVVGGAGEPLLVSDPDNLQAELNKAELVKATKLRVWVLMVPLPKIPPIILAALAITENVTADTLYGYTMQIISGLQSKNIWPISYACDGTEKERANQKLVRVQAHSTDTRRISSPSNIIDDLILEITLLPSGQPIALVQDSAHGRKTFRNNLETGTKTLVLGDFCAMYKHIREMSYSATSPLYKRDVEKTDKQDDRAAERVFSASALAWLEANQPNYLGSIYYLFIFGELVDAYQNRFIRHADRIRMVLRAFYFVELWKKFLQAAGYPQKTSCISREALDITTFLIKGFFELFFIYRDYLAGSVIPLLPWLHSSEACEHVFAECRKEVTDFDFATFLHLVPKIQWMVRYSMRLGVEDAKARAAGYAHTWADTSRLCISNLASFPNDDEISGIATLAFNDAEILWRQLGVYTRFIRHPRHITSSLAYLLTPGGASRDETAVDSDDSDDSDDAGDGRVSTLPSLSSWYPDLPSAICAAERLLSEAPVHGIVESERAVLEKLLEQDEQSGEGTDRPNEDNRMMRNITCAKLFLDLDTSLRIEDMELPTDEEYNGFLADYKQAIGNALADSLPSIIEPSTDIRSLMEPASQITTNELLALRKEHETELARNAVRTGTSSDEDTAHNKDVSRSESTDSMARRTLVKKISEVLKLQQERGVTTGLGRKARWTNGSQSGNAANAAVTAASRASGVLSKRCAVYASFRTPANIIPRLSSGGVQEFTPLRDGAFAIVFHSDQLLIAQMMSIYSKGGGKHGKHAWTEEVTSIGQASYISVQLYEHAGGPIFQELLSSMFHLGVKSFAHMPHYELVCTLPDYPIVHHDKKTIELSKPAERLWQDISSFSNTFPAIMKEFRKRN